MKIFIIGGTGLLGSEAAKELIARGHSVHSIALPPLPPGAQLPKEMEISFGNYLEMSDEELSKAFTGCDAFVFAAGVDERVEGSAPIYDLFKKYNIDPVQRLLRLAKANRVKHAVILGSYFSYFHKVMPKEKLAKWHPYIRSRIHQEAVAMAEADENFDVAVLELPYIFGSQPGRKPVWLFLVEMIRSMKGVTLYPRGGTTMVTVKQVGQAVAGAVERNRGGHCYPIGYYNMTWKEMLRIVHKYMGMSKKKIITIPNWMFTLYGRKIKQQQIAKNIDGGLNAAKLAPLQCSRLYIDKSLGSEPLGVAPDDIDRAIGDSIQLCLDILDSKVDAIAMKGE